MVEIRPEQFESMSLGAALSPLQLIAGQKIGLEPFQTIPSILDDAATTQDILEHFYNGGAFRSIRSIVTGGYGRLREDESNPYHTMRYTFTELVRAGHTPTSSSDSYEGPSIGYEKRSYIVKYYPDSQEISGDSYFLDRSYKPTDPAYSVTISPEAITCNYPIYEAQHPTASEFAIARAAVQHLTFDVARDTAHGLSGT